MNLRLLLLTLALCAVGQCASTFKMCQVDAATDQVVAGACFTVSTEIMESFDKYLATQYTLVNGQKVYAYSSFLDLVVKHFITTLVSPILDTYPTASIQALKDSAAVAQAVVEAAKASSLTVE